MTDQPTHEVRYARRFVATIPGQPDIHGVEFPSGRVIADTETGLTAFLTASVITDEYDGAVIHWADEKPAGQSSGPSVGECASSDRNYDVEQGGE